MQLGKVIMRVKITHVNVVGGGFGLQEFGPVEDVSASKLDLGVPVLASLQVTVEKGAGGDVQGWEKVIIIK